MHTLDIFDCPSRHEATSRSVPRAKSIIARHTPRAHAVPGPENARFSSIGTHCAGIGSPGVMSGFSALKTALGARRDRRFRRHQSAAKTASRMTKSGTMTAGMMMCAAPLDEGPCGLEADTPEVPRGGKAAARGAKSAYVQWFVKGTH